jgi:hypothetical protein
MDDKAKHKRVSNQSADPSLPIGPNVKAGHERILGKPGTPESAQEKDDNIELTRELIKVEKGQLRINAFLAVITAVAVCVAIFSATKSINLTRATSHLDQRAWVAATGVTGTTEVDKPVVTTVAIKNSGRTFAKEVCIDALRRALPKDSEPDLNYAPSATNKSVGLMAPDTEYSSVGIGDTDVREEDFEPVRRTGEKRIFVSGIITYVDVFHCKHWTKFCWVVNPKHPDPAHWTYDAYKVGNDADSNECP